MMMNEKKTKTTESVPWYTRFEWREHIKWLSPFSCLCIHIRFRSRHASTMKCNYIKCSTFNTLSTHIFRTVAQWHHRISVYFRRVLLIQSKKKTVLLLPWLFVSNTIWKCSRTILTDNEMVLFNKSILCLWYNHMWWIECIYLQTKEKQMITK